MRDLFGPLHSKTDIERSAAPGREALVIAAVVIGVLLLAIQIWLLTVALDIYLAGERGQLWVLAVLSGLVFVGGIAAIRVIARGSWPRGR